MKKTVYKTYKFFMHFVRHMSFKDRMAPYGIKSGLKQFQALGIFLILQIEGNTHSGSILVDEMEYRKVRYLLF